MNIVELVQPIDEAEQLQIFAEVKGVLIRFHSRQSIVIIVVKVLKDLEIIADLEPRNALFCSNPYVALGIGGDKINKVGRESLMRTDDFLLA
jgi:hypothetical protein